MGVVEAGVQRAAADVACSTNAMLTTMEDAYILSRVMDGIKHQAHKRVAWVSKVHLESVAVARLKGVTNINESAA